jgi:hypothetical protein
VKESGYINWVKMAWAVAGDSFHLHIHTRCFLYTVFIAVVCMYDKTKLEN